MGTRTGRAGNRQPYPRANSAVSASIITPSNRVKHALFAIVGETNYIALGRWKMRGRHWVRLLTRVDPWVLPRRLYAMEERGGWFVNTEGLNKSSVVYSFGIGRDLTFELSLVRDFSCTVHAFDPTPAALEWVRAQHLPPELKIHEIGIA